VVADPLVAGLGGVGGKVVEAELGPGGDALGELDGLVLGVVGGIDAVGCIGRAGESFEAVDGEVGVELNHQGLGRDGIGAVDLDLVVVLGAEMRCQDETENECG
jgi:hypothetical protein